MDKKIKSSITVLILIFSVPVLGAVILKKWIIVSHIPVPQPTDTYTNHTADESEIESENIQSITVYITATGKKYHMDGHRYLSLTQIPVLLDEINTNKYSQCSVCNPPEHMP